MRYPDNYDQFKKHDWEEILWFNSLPECCSCGRKIQDEYLFDDDGALYHVGCAAWGFKRRSEDYIR